MWFRSPTAPLPTESSAATPAARPPYDLEAPAKLATATLALG